MTTLAEKQEAARIQAERHRKDVDSVAQTAAAVLSTPDGQALLAHLWKRFDVEGRSFLATDRGEVNALRAAVRDGERAAVQYLFQLARKSNPELPHP